MSQAPGAALRVENIEVVYHHTIQVLRGLSLEVSAGAMVALLGSNGAGKTTTLKAVSGLLPLEKGEVRSGDILVDGRSLHRVAPHLIARSGIGHVREGRHVFEDLSVEENLVAATLALKGRPEAGKPDFERLFHYFPRLAERRRQRAGYLSGGEQQMLAISRALIGKPRLMLLDEPSLGLAPKVVEEIFAIIARINCEEGVSMLLVEQNAFAAFDICSHAYIMEGGKIVVNGPVSRLRDDPDVQRFYLGYSEGQAAVASFRDVKHYKRRKRWLS